MREDGGQITKSNDKAYPSLLKLETQLVFDVAALFH